MSNVRILPNLCAKAVSIDLAPLSLSPSFPPAAAGFRQISGFDRGKVADNAHAAAAAAVSTRTHNVPASKKDVKL